MNNTARTGNKHGMAPSNTLALKEARKRAPDSGHVVKPPEFKFDDNKLIEMYKRDQMKMEQQQQQQQQPAPAPSPQPSPQPQPSVAASAKKRPYLHSNIRVKDIATKDLDEESDEEAPNRKKPKSQYKPKKESNKSNKLTKLQQLRRDSCHHNKYFSTTAAKPDDKIRDEMKEQRKRQEQN